MHWNYIKCSFYNWKKRTVHPILPFQRLNYICCSFNECEALWICIQLLNSLHIVLLCILQLFTLVLYMCTLLKRTKLFICLGAAKPHFSWLFKKRERIRRYNKRHVSSSLQSIPPKYYVRNTGEYRALQQCIVLFCATYVRILYSHTYRQARKYLCLDTVIYRFVVTCKRLHAQQWLTNLSTAITFFPNRPKVLSCVLTRNEMNYCLKKCNDTLWYGVPLLAQLAKNAQGHGRRYWTTITRNKLMKNNVSITNRIRTHK